MAEVTGYTAAFIEDQMVVDGAVVGDNLILKTPSGREIDAGDVRGPQGYGSAEIHGLTEIGSTPDIDDEIVLYDASAALNKKSAFSRIYDFVKGRFASASENDNVFKIAGIIAPINPNKINMAYISGLISTVNVRNEADTADISTATMTYSDQTLTSISVTSGGTTVVYTLNYTGTDITSITKAVS